MLELATLTEWMVSFIRTYGYVALFVFIVLETAWIIHFVPSEVVIPLVAAYVVTTPEAFALFVVVGTVGAVVGSLLAYFLFGVYGDVVLARYGHILRIPEDELDRSKAWLRRWGEGLMFWGRVVPVLRTPISVPAGFARMELRRFTVYSFGGWAIYNTVLVWLVYGGADERSPMDYLLEVGSDVARGSPAVAVLVVGCAVLAAGWWWRRKRTTI